MEEDVVTMETGRKSTPSWVWIVIAIILAALVAVGVMLCKRGAFGGATGGDNVGVVLPAPTTTTEPAPAPTSKPAEDPLASVEAARAAVTAAEAAAVASNERFHVIAGAFSIESNADNFIARLKREYPELTPRKIADASKGLYLVSIIQTATRREASGKMNLYRDLDLWIYEQ
jgi:hypothetical protein